MVRFSIGAKLIIGFGIVVLFMGANVLIGMNALTNVVGHYEGDALRTAQVTRLTEQLAFHMLEQRYEMLTYLLNVSDSRDGVGDPDGTVREAFNEAGRQFEEVLEQIRTAMSGSEQLPLLEEIRADHEAYAEAVN